MWVISWEVFSNAPFFTIVSPTPNLLFFLKRIYFQIYKHMFMTYKLMTVTFWGHLGFYTQFLLWICCPFFLTMMKENPVQREIQSWGHAGMSVVWLWMAIAIAGPSQTVHLEHDTKNVVASPLFTLYCAVYSVVTNWIIYLVSSQKLKDWIFTC